MFDTGIMNENLFLSLYFKNKVDVLFWSIILDIVVAIKITFYKDCLLTFRDYRVVGWVKRGLGGMITHPREQFSDNSSTIWGNEMKLGLSLQIGKDN